jgi:hypothetical protein
MVKGAGIDPINAAGSSGTTAAWIMGGSRLARRRNVPRQIEPLTFDSEAADIPPAA